MFSRLTDLRNYIEHSIRLKVTSFGHGRAVPHSLFANIPWHWTKSSPATSCRPPEGGARPSKICEEEACSPARRQLTHCYEQVAGHSCCFAAWLSQSCRCCFCRKSGVT